MAVPKRRMSRSNTRHRRSQWKATVPTLVTCANPACREKHLPHVACPSCGASFLATLQADSARQVPRAGFVMRLPRAARLTAAVVLSLVVAVLVPLVLTLFG